MDSVASYEEKPLALTTGTQAKVRRQMDAESFRQKIVDGRLIQRAILIAQGTEEATMQSVSMIKTLLSKILPDLQAIALITDDNSPIDRGSIDALAAAHGINVDDLWADKPVIEAKSELIEVKSDEASE